MVQMRVIEVMLFAMVHGTAWEGLEMLWVYTGLGKGEICMVGKPAPACYFLKLSFVLWSLLLQSGTQVCAGADTISH